jgi:hypothetical protein
MMFPNLARAAYPSIATVLQSQAAVPVSPAESFQHIVAQQKGGTIDPLPGDRAICGACSLKDEANPAWRERWLAPGVLAALKTLPESTILSPHGSLWNLGPAFASSLGASARWHRKSLFHAGARELAPLPVWSRGS